MQDFLTAGTLVKIVDILRDECEPRQELAHHCDCAMASVWLRGKHPGTPPFIPAPHQPGIALERIRRCELRRIVPLPKTDELVSKGRNATFCGHPGSREDGNVSSRAKPFKECRRELWHVFQGGCLLLVLDAATHCSGPFQEPCGLWFVLRVTPVKCDSGTLHAAPTRYCGFDPQGLPFAK